MESAHFIKSGTLIKLSEQQCLDCARKDGCKGGYQEDCFEYAEEGDKMNTEAEYPYTSWADKCWPKYDGNVDVVTYKEVAKNSVD